MGATGGLNIERGVASGTRRVLGTGGQTLQTLTWKLRMETEMGVGRWRDLSGQSGGRRSWEAPSFRER